MGKCQENWPDVVLCVIISKKQERQEEWLTDRRCLATTEDFVFFAVPSRSSYVHDTTGNSNETYLDTITCGMEGVHNGESLTGVER